MLDEVCGELLPDVVPSEVGDELVARGDLHEGGLARPEGRLKPRTPHQLSEGAEESLLIQTYV